MLNAESKLSDFADDESGYTAPDGSWCEDAETLLQSHWLGMCCCYAPEANLRYVLGNLERIEAQDYSIRDTDAGAFFCYWADSAGLTEHGTSIPGWLTDKGRGLLGMLREWSALPQQGEG